ncbi:MAG TPA: hypothetical protein EYG83_08855 [Sulfurospirillum arcachonense]|nr:hypothetical protein [Sulfurospirillum arcachonense]
MLFSISKKKSDKRFQKIINNLPTTWLNVDNEYYKGNKDEDGNKLGYFAFEVSEKEALFLFGGCAIAHELLEVFVNSSYVKTIEWLDIGIFNESHGSYDYEESVKILEKCCFPQLKYFSIGSYNEMYNGGMNFTGKLGDVTELLEQMPNLEELELDGWFELKKPLEFLELKELYILSESDSSGWFSDFMPNDISQQTLDNFLSSNFPELVRLELGLSEDSNFTFNRELIGAKRVPKLERLDISEGFKVGDKALLIDVLLGKK